MVRLKRRPLFYRAPRGPMTRGGKITEYNPAKSREQLKSLGLENLTLKLWVPTRSQAWNPSPLKTAELIQADMAQVG